MMESKLTISVPEAARRLGISKPTAYTLARRADFPAFRIGERVVVYAAGLEEWVRAQAEGRPPQYENGGAAPYDIVDGKAAAGRAIT